MFTLLLSLGLARQVEGAEPQKERLKRPMLLVKNGHSRAITAVAFSRDGRLLITGSADHSAIVWATATGQPLRRLGRHGFHILAVSLSADGRYAATAGWDATVRLWAVETGEELWRHEFEGYGGPYGRVDQVVFPSDGQHVLAAGEDGSIRFLAREQKGAEDRPRRVAHRGFNTSVFSVDGRHALARDRMGGARLLATSTGREVQRFACSGESRSLSAAMALDVQHVAMVCGESEVEIFSVDGAKPSRKIAVDGAARAIAFTPDGLHLFIATNKGAAGLWRIDGNTKVHELARAPLSDREDLSLALSVDGRYAAVGGGG